MGIAMRVPGSILGGLFSLDATAFLMAVWHVNASICIVGKLRFLKAVRGWCCIIGRLGTGDLIERFYIFDVEAVHA